LVIIHFFPQGRQNAKKNEAVTVRSKTVTAGDGAF